MESILAEEESNFCSIAQNLSSWADDDDWLDAWELVEQERSCVVVSVEWWAVLDMVLVVAEDDTDDGCLGSFNTIFSRTCAVCSWISTGTGLEDAWKVPFFVEMNFVWVEME